MNTRNFSLAVMVSTSMTLIACGSSSDSNDDPEIQQPVVEDPVTDPVVDPVTDPVVDPVTDPVVDPVIDPVTDPMTDPVVELPDPTVDLPEPVVDPVTDPVVELPDPVVELPDPVVNPATDPIIDLPDPVVDLPDAAIQLAERMLGSATETDLVLSKILTSGPDQAWKCDQSEDDQSLPELTSSTVFARRSDENPDRGTGTFLLDSDPMPLPTNMDWDFTNDVLTIVDTSSLETLEQWFNINIDNTDSFTAVSFGGLDVSCFAFDVAQP